jgi:putative peptide zinc metalloprotease protein
VKRTFFDQWHRIAGLRLGLRPGIVVRLHHYRDEPWYVLHQPAHAGYFRVSPTSWRFIAGLSPAMTVDERWRQAVQEQPELAPGQEEAFELVTALYRNNLLYVEGGVDEDKLVERYRRKKKKPWANRLSELLFMRIPLWDPEPWLKRHQAFFAGLWQWPTWLLAAAIMAWALLEFVLAGPRVWTQAQDILQLGNLLPLYLAIFVNHLLHEMAHAIASKHFGGQVRTMGLMLLLFTPLPYVDLSSNWTFRDRLQRAWVSSAGMATDLVVGALATIVWAYSPPGLLNELAYNLMFSTAVYTFLFNINPLMRFDGYYVLSDVLGIPNLHEAAKQAFQRWWRLAVLGQPPTLEDGQTSGRRQLGLALFFVSSNVYRWAVMVGIVLFVADQYWGLGLVVGLALLYATFVLPMKNLLRPLRNPVFLSQQRHKLRAAVLVLAALLAVLTGLPLPESRVLRGVVEAQANTPVHAQSGARVLQVHVRPGQWVQAGQLLVELENPELQQELAALGAQLRQAQAQQRKAVNEASVDLGPIEDKLRTLQQARAQLQLQLQALRVLAPHEGQWTSADIQHLQGTWVGRGKELGRVIDERSQVFLGVLRQEAAINWDALTAEGAQVRIEGHRAQVQQVRRLTVLPHSQKDLPSAALTPLAGGDQAVSARDQSGRQAVEQFFLLRAQLQGGVDTVEAGVLHSRSGWIRLTLPPRPLAPRALEALQQFFQRRYQV